MTMFRKAVSLSLLIAFAALSTSGMMMIFLNSFEFQLQMHPVHKIFGVVLTIAVPFHLYYNFNAIKDYLKEQRLAIFTGLLTVVLVALYAIGLNKPLDKEKIKQIETIMQTLEG